MPVEVIMPKVDMDMAKGTLSVWHVEEGVAVVKGAPLFDIETDKAAMEVESPASGRLHHVIAQPGDTIDVGAPVAWIYAEGEAVGDRPAGSDVPLPAARPVGPTPDRLVEAAPSSAIDDTPPTFAAQPGHGSAGSRVPDGAPRPSIAPQALDLRATPAARRIARQDGIALETLSGTGPQGRIQSADVAEAVKARAASTVRARSGEPVSTRPALRETFLEALPAASWTAEGGELHVTTRKGTGTPLLLIHGFAADSAGWAPFERELPRDLPLIRIDLPSHGRSPRQRIGGFPDLLRAVTHAFDQLDTGPVHLLGHSLGGAVALALADIRPRQVASMTLLAPAGLGPEVDGATLNGIARASRVESLAPWLKCLTATPDAISWDFARAAMLSRTDPALRAAQVDFADALFPDGVQAFDLNAALSRLEAPAAIVWGRDDRIIPWRHALAAQGAIALHLLKRVGHLPYVECPALLAEIVGRHVGQTRKP